MRNRLSCEEEMLLLTSERHEEAVGLRPELRHWRLTIGLPSESSAAGPGGHSTDC